MMLKIEKRRPARIRLGVLLLVFVLLPATRSEAKNLPEVIDINACTEEALTLYLYLAEYSSRVYGIDEDELVVGPHGCAALVEMDEHNNLIIAFRGSVNPIIRRVRHATMQARYLVDLLRLRRYQDWFQTNILQGLGFLPAQYIDAAELIVDEISKHPTANKIFITGHSKGGGIAEAAAAVAWLDEDIPADVKQRIMAVTFNAAVVHLNNWRILYKESDPALVKAYLAGDVPKVDAVIMRDDIVPKIRWRNRRLRPFVNLVVIDPSEWIWPADQHSIAVVIDELKRRLGIRQPQTEPQECAPCVSRTQTP